MVQGLVYLGQNFSEQIVKPVDLEAIVLGLIIKPRASGDR